MPGSFDWESKREPLGREAVPIVVALYDGDGGFTPLPNVYCEGIDAREGPEPPVARFRYVAGVGARARGFPTEVADLWPLGAGGPYVVQVDDRLVVVGYTPKGERRFLFDGFAQVPQADLGPSSQSVTFVAVGVAARCWDSPVLGRVQRDADDLVNGKVVQTDLPARFNPVDRFGKARPNCTPADGDADAEQASIAHPVFVEEDLERSPDDRRFWTLAGAAKYLLATFNHRREFVKHPDFGRLDSLLTARRPRSSSPRFDPSDPSSYDESPIVLREYDASNKPWPDVLDDLLSAEGFRMGWTLDADESGRPRTSLQVERVDADGLRGPKVVWLDEAGSAIDPARNSIEQLHLARDVNQVVNAFHVATNVRRAELSVVLAPAFTPTAGEEGVAQRKRFFKSNLASASAEDKRKYRWYVADEAGDGHWDGTSWTTEAPLDLSKAFPDVEGARGYVRRRRPGSHQLLSRDSLGRPRQSMLAFSQDYAGPTAAIWDGTGTWKAISGGWQLLEDRLGIEVTIEDPEQWYAGKERGDIRGVTWQAAPPPGKRLFLRLTTVVDEDRQLDALAKRRASCPTRFVRLRTADGRGDYRVDRVHSSSPYYTGSDGGPWQVVRDDETKAKAHAEALRSAHESPPIAGSVVIPFCTNAYAIGDRIRKVQGRGVDLVANVGSSQGEAPAHPRVVGISWDFSGDRQSTTLHLSDLRAEPRG